MGISSAPYLIDPVQFGLNKVETNKKRLRDLKEFPSKKVGVYKGKDLIEYTKSSTESFIIMEHDEQIIYLVHLIVAKLNQFEQTSVTQVEVWRDDSYSNYVRGGLLVTFFGRSYSLVTSMLYPIRHSPH